MFYCIVPPHLTTFCRRLLPAPWGKPPTRKGAGEALGTPLRGATGKPFRLPSELIACATVLLCGIILLTPAPSHAARKKDNAVYATATVPYWSVGAFSFRLSRACQKRLFGQKREYRYIIAFVGSKGRAITGIATSNWNLFDPTGLALPNQAYHFFNDGFSNCEVYVSQQPRR